MFCFTIDWNCQWLLIFETTELISLLLYICFLDTRTDWQVYKYIDKQCDLCRVSFCNPWGMTMQILADGYVNVNVVVLLKLDVVTHLINFKYINNFFRKVILRNVVETFHPLQNSYLLVRLWVLWNLGKIFYSWKDFSLLEDYMTDGNVKKLLNYLSAMFR